MPAAQAALLGAMSMLLLTCSGQAAGAVQPQADEVSMPHPCAAMAWQVMNVHSVAIVGRPFRPSVLALVTPLGCRVSWGSFQPHGP